MVHSSFCLDGELLDSVSFSCRAHHLERYVIRITKYPQVISILTQLHKEIDTCLLIFLIAKMSKSAKLKSEYAGRPW